MPERARKFDTLTLSANSDLSNSILRAEGTSRTKKTIEARWTTIVCGSHYGNWVIPAYDFFFPLGAFLSAFFSAAGFSDFFLAGCLSLPSPKALDQFSQNFGLAPVRTMGPLIRDFLQLIVTHPVELTTGTSISLPAARLHEFSLRPCRLSRIDGRSRLRSREVFRFGNTLGIQPFCGDEPPQQPAERV